MDVVPGVERLEPERLRPAPARRGRLAENDSFEPARAGDECREESDRPTSEHDGSLARLDLGARDGVDADAERLDQDPLMLGDRVGDDDQVLLRDQDVLCEPAGELAPEEAHVGAELWLQAKAVEAGAAPDRREDDNGRIGADPVRVGSELLDRAVDLVADEERWAEERVGAGPHLQIRAADTAVVDANAHLTRAGHGDRTGADREMPRRFEHRIPTVGHQSSRAERSLEQGGE